MQEDAQAEASSQDCRFHPLANDLVSLHHVTTNGAHVLVLHRGFHQVLDGLSIFHNMPQRHLTIGLSKEHVGIGNPQLCHCRMLDLQVQVLRLILTTYSSVDPTKDGCNAGYVCCFLSLSNCQTRQVQNCCIELWHCLFTRRGRKEEGGRHDTQLLLGFNLPRSNNAHDIQWRRAAPNHLLVHYPTCGTRRLRHLFEELILWNLQVNTIQSHWSLNTQHPHIPATLSIFSELQLVTTQGSLRHQHQQWLLTWRLLHTEARLSWSCTVWHLTGEGVHSV
mmetsp:Transcript_8591/g.15404  ORF Transcript_8591/g.15404 Transcript_8591/m.15404 type:complete len:278 (-) Transcript_8591:586-1419(-)